MDMTGYHGTTVENSTKILSEGFKVLKNNKNLWLGFGVYFFLEEIYAFKWILDLYKNKNETTGFENLSKEMVILKVNIDLKEDRLLDLATYEGELLFDKTYNILKRSTNPKVKEMLTDKKYVAAVVINYLFEKLNVGVRYDAVKEIYRINPKNYQYILIKPQLGVPQFQICVKNLAIIKNIEIMEYKDNIAYYLKSWSELISAQPLIKIKSQRNKQYK